MICLAAFGAAMLVVIAIRVVAVVHGFRRIDYYRRREALFAEAEAIKAMPIGSAKIERRLRWHRDVLKLSSDYADV